MQQSQNSTGNQQPITSIPDEAILSLFKLIDQRTKIANLLDAFENARNSPIQNKDSIYLLLYFALEKFIISNRPPVVKAQFNKMELRRYVRQRIDINQLSPRLKLIFVPQLYQGILLFDIISKDITDYISTNLGQLRYSHVLATAVRGTMFESLWKSGINSAGAEGMFHETSKDEVINSLNTIYEALYGEVEKFFGKKIATSIVMKSYSYFSSKYDEDMLALYLQIIPQKILTQERAAFFNHQKDQQRQSPTLESRASLTDMQTAETPFVGLGESPETISQARLAEEKLREERDLVRAIVDSIGDGLFVVDRQGLIIMMNPIATRLLGLITSQVVGKPQSEVLTLYKNERQIGDQDNPITTVIKTGNYISIKLEENAYFKTAGGKKIPVELTASPLWKNSVSIEEGITGCVVVFRDVTEQRKLDEVKSNFLSIASHQLRTPLTAMRWFVEMIMEGDAGSLTSEQSDLLQKAYESTDRMSNLVNHLLQIVRVETNRLKVDPTPINFTEITERIILTLQTDDGKKDQKFTINADVSTIPQISMDYDMLWQVIINLLANACRYSPKNSPIVITITHDEAKQEVTYAIKDSGIGIPDNQKDLIFKKFFRANNAIKAAPDGTGIGLWLARALVESWGGKIWFDSIEQQGTTFYFTIPDKGMIAQTTYVPLTA